MYSYITEKKCKLELLTEQELKFALAHFTQDQIDCIVPQHGIEHKVCCNVNYKRYRQAISRLNASNLSEEK